MEIIQEIGSYAGLAAVLGLAVLSALYFSQARDVRRLRDWAGRAPERTSEPAAQPARVVGRPVPKPPGAQATSPGLRPLGHPAPSAAAAAASGATPAVAGGPAAATPAAARAAEAAAAGDRSGDGVSQDTMAHPPPSPFGDEAEDQPSEEADAAQATDDSPGVVEDVEPDDEHEDEWDEERGDDDDLEDFEGEDIETGERPPAPAPAPARPVPPPPRTATLPPRGTPATPAGARPAAPRPPAPRPGGAILPPYERSRPDGDPWYRRVFYSPRRAAVVIVAGVLVLAAATLGGLQLAADDEPDSPAAGQPLGSGQASGNSNGAGGSDGDAQQPAIDPSQVTVAVLNGTTVTGLAADIGDRVESEGFQLGNVTNSLDQERAESVVFYAPGAEAEAEDVGRRLQIAQREEIDPETQALAGDASVVVVVGADKT